jgi:hypothetical protein
LEIDSFAPYRQFGPEEPEVVQTSVPTHLSRKASHSAAHCEDADLYHTVLPLQVARGGATTTPHWAELLRAGRNYQLAGTTEAIGSLELGEFSFNLGPCRLAGGFVESCEHLSQGAKRLPLKAHAFGG